MLKVGDKVPVIEVKDINNEKVSLADLDGQYVVLYFYPKDDTPGCTKEACSFRDWNAELKKIGVKVVGVSKDSAASHKKFIEKYELNFDLWSDEDHQLIEVFGAWQKKNMMGREYMGTVRSTFVIDPKGVVLRVWDKVNPPEHGEEVYNFIKEVK
jgi:peroxiredoxin Q/BCP